ncbi:hypothetical protein WG66_016842 [Moniliophthora roreri]|nr:hypothetical protein WG66_016842 [Moniliophthora roreri]
MYGRGFPNIPQQRRKYCPRSMTRPLGAKYWVPSKQDPPSISASYNHNPGYKTITYSGPPIMQSRQLEESGIGRDLAREKRLRTS